MKELTCAFTLTLVSLVAATPHGYGVKGVATAKAEASAVAGGLSALPLSIPSGTGYSGSFSKSASSSFASSSASSSSSSFSYSGSGSTGLAGFGTNSNGGCSTGGCHNGGAGVAGPQGFGDFGPNGSQAHSGANAAATAGANALTGSLGSSKDSSPACTSGGCSNQLSSNLNSEAHLPGDEKTAFSESDNAALSGSSGNESNNKCTSGKCGLIGQPEPTATDYQPAPQFGLPSISYNSGTNCASGKCGPTSQPEIPASAYGSSSDCSSGKCASTSQSSASSINNGPSGNCASGKCGPTSHPGAPSTNYNPSGDCTTGACGSVSQSGSPSTSYEPKSDCASGQCGPSSNPSNDNGHPGAASPSTDLNSCKSGKCEPNTLTGPASPNYDPNDIPVVVSGTFTPKSKQNVKVKSSDYDKVSTDCSFGNCGQSTSPNFKPSYSGSSSTTYQNANLANQNQGSSNFGYSSNAFGSGLASGYNKPATHLTTPKQESSYNPGYTFDASHEHTPSGGNTCTGDKCESGTKCTSSNCTPNTYNNENPKTPSYSAAPVHQVPIGSGSLNCASGNCATYPSAQPSIGISSVSAGQYKPSYSHSQPSQQTPLGPTGSAGFSSIPSSNGAYPTVPKNPSQSGLPSYITPTGSDSTNCKTPNCASYPSTNINTPAGANIQPGVPSLVDISIPGTSDQKVPVYTGNEAYPTVPKNPAQSGLPSYITPTRSDSTNCRTPNCASYPSTNINTPAGVNIQPGVPSLVDISKPGTPDQKVPVYTGGFGGPAGILKPNEFSTVSVGINKPGYPLSQSSHHAPAGVTGIPSHHSGFGTSPTVSNNPSVTHPEKPSYNTPTGSDSSNCKTSNCGSYPSNGDVATAGATAGATSQSGAPASVDSSKPPSLNQKLPVYTGGFGGAAGFLKPNDFSFPTQVPASHSYSKPTVPLGAHNPATCTSGNCGSQSLLPHGSPSNGAPASAIAAAGANAEADAVAYTGGFGGPPGLLKPYDDGKLSSGDLIKHPSNSPFGVHQGVSSSGIHSYGSDNNKHDTGSHAGGNAVAGAQASAIAGASSGSASGSTPHGYGSHSGNYDYDHKGPGGCGGGCGSNNAGSYIGSGQLGYNSGLGLTKHGQYDGLGSSLSGSGSGATAKSLAGAVSGANAFGTSGNFASSSATAHASAGAGIKGSYSGR